MKSKENIIAKDIVDAAYQIHVALGPGLLESVYEQVLSYELEKRGHKVDRQVFVPITYDGKEIGDAFRADLVVDDLIIIELKSVEALLPIHKKQLTTYIKLSNKRLGLLINFGAVLIKQGIVRLVNGLDDD